MAKGSASCCTHSLTHVHKRVSAELVTHSPSEAPEQLSCCRNRQWATVNPRAVLEVGDGALAHHLSRRFYGFARVVATDSGCDLAARCCGAPASAANATTTTTSSSAASCSASSSPVAAADVPTGAFAVERLDAEAALSAHAPRIVLCSWMPSGIDWTRAMRACPSVHEYLLIGEPDGSTCGDGWATWGQLFDGYEEYGLDEESEPPFKEDGFVRAPCDEVSRYQRCRFDSALHASAHHSALSLR